MFGDGGNRRHRREMEEGEKTQGRLHVTRIANATAVSIIRGTLNLTNTCPTLVVFYY